MAVLRTLFNKEAGWRQKWLALANIVGMGYFVSMTAINTYLGLFQIVPRAFKKSQDTAMLHYTFIVFLFVNVGGNFAYAVFANNKVYTLGRDVLRGPSVQSRPRCKRCKDKVRMPPRTHHCVICNTCILKRDHHCFFMCTCIGYYNQKYFILFCFYMMLAGLYAVVLIIMYLNILYNVKFTSPFTFVTLIPDTVRAWMKFPKKVPVHQLFLVGIFYGSLGAGLMAASFLYWQIYITISGQTTYEARRGILDYCKSLRENFLDVFGPYWYISLFIAIPLPQAGNGLYKKQPKKIITQNSSEEEPETSLPETTKLKRRKVHTKQGSVLVKNEEG